MQESGRTGSQQPGNQNTRAHRTPGTGWKENPARKNGGDAPGGAHDPHAPGQRPPDAPKTPQKAIFGPSKPVPGPQGPRGGVKGPPRANGGLLRALFPAGPGEIPGPPEESTDGREKTRAGPEPGGEVRPGLLTTRAHTAGGDARPGDRGRRGVVYSGKSPGIIRLPLPITPPARAHSHRHGPRSHRRQRNFPTAPGPKNQLSIYIEIFLGGAKNISKQAIKAITLLWPFSRP